MFPVAPGNTDRCFLQGPLRSQSLLHGVGEGWEKAECPLADVCTMRLLPRTSQFGLKTMLPPIARGRCSAVEKGLWVLVLKIAQRLFQESFRTFVPLILACRG